MPDLLPTIGVLSYTSAAGSYTFGVKSRTSLEGRPVYDEAGRTITHIAYTLQVVSYIIPGSSDTTTDNAMAAIRKILLTPGGILHYDGGGAAGQNGPGPGFGGLTVNAQTAGPLDVAWGPKPLYFRAKPVGSNLAWIIEWGVEVAVPECAAGSVQYLGALMAFNWDVAWHIDRNGYTTRTINGYLEIPITRPLPNARITPDNADAYREKIEPPIPIGFQRTRDYKLSADRRRLDFTFVDEEIPPGGLPANCTDATGSHTIENAFPNSFIKIAGTIAATYTLPSTKAPQTAWLAFLDLINDRVRATGQVGKSLMLTGLRLTEGLYRDSMKHSFQIQYLYASSLQNLLAESGLFRKVPNTDDGVWAQSVTSISGPRGGAQLRFQNAFDAIVDLCIAPTKVDQEQGNPQQPGGQTVTLRAGAPDPESSWLKYENVLEMEQKGNIVRLKTMPTIPPPDPKQPGTTATLETQGMGEATMQTITPAELLARQKAGQDDNSWAKMSSQERPTATLRTITLEELQQRTGPTYRVTMRGVAVRIAYDIPYPQLIAVGGAPAVPDDQWTGKSVIGNLGGMMIYKAEWVFKYILLQPPIQVIGTPSNPAVRAPG